MSNILNALRKSERERKALQTPTLTEQVLRSPPPKRGKTLPWVVGLLALNAAAIPLGIWYAKQTSEPAEATKAPMPRPQSQPMQPEPPVAMENVGGADEGHMDEEVPPPTANAENAAVAPPGMLSPRTLSIEEMVRPRQEAAVQKNAQKAAPVQRVTPPVKTNERAMSKSQAEPEPAFLDVEIDLTTGDPDAEAARPGTAPPAAASSAAENIPFLRDLPFRFRNTVPELTINVFKYDDNPSERFVIVNMAKYKAGESTKDAVEIKEIRADSVVASYNGQKFRLERP